MRVIAPCPVCIDEQVKAGSKNPGMNPVAGQLDDAGFIRVHCGRGHDGIVVYDARRYQVLIESAARAYVDGYTNEVVAVMSSALERAYEFYVRVSCRARGLEDAEIDVLWKAVSTQSERQFGAFHFLFRLDQGELITLDPKISQVRNSVVHRGKIASEEEALQFAESVYSQIRLVEAALNTKFQIQAVAEATSEVRRQEALFPNDSTRITMKKTTVRVDSAKSVATGVVESFIEVAASIHHSRERGFPA